MRLYHHPMSLNARRAVMAAHHLGANVELVLVDLSKGAQRAPDYLRINPSGKVPTLDDEGFYLTESHAIMQYLAEKTPGQTVYPTELQARADINRWLFWSAHELTPSVSMLNWENAIKPMLGLGVAEPALVRRGEERFLECARMLDAHLATRTWIAQDRLTLADLAVAASLMAIGSAKLPVQASTNVLSWFARVQELDAWKKTSL